MTKFLGHVAGAVLAILPIVNPLGAVPLVMTVAAHLPAAERLRQIRRACVYTFVMMAGFLLAGGLIMSFFGISVPGMRIAGGMIVASLGFQMLFPSAPLPSRELERETGHKADIAFTPLAMPGLAGAGTFAVIMSLSSQASARLGFERVLDFTAVLLAIVIVALLCFATLRAAERLQRVLGPTGMIALTRLTGFLMVCIGVQFIIDGLTAILRDPEFWSGLSQAVATH
ncbi:MAG TPA: MarC family NAAT transporter [Steroidobacteraceae bacterium]|jgi:multiple antibiotic resistance protein|nr:MarC family NAAT transporter [Steroidobacteraceae bacterium]